MTNKRVLVGGHNCRVEIVEKPRGRYRYAAFKAGSDDPVAHDAVSHSTVEKALMVEPRIGKAVRCRVEQHGNYSHQDDGAFSWRRSEERAMRSIDRKGCYP